MEPASFKINAALWETGYVMMVCPSCDAEVQRDLTWLRSMAGAQVPCVKCGVLHFLPHEERDI